MEKIGKALERRGASFVWREGADVEGGNSRAGGEVQGAGPRCQAGGKLSTGTDRRCKKSGKGPPEPTDLQGSPGSAR